MSELINNSNVRKARLKELILKLHEGETPDKVREQLVESLEQVPYGEVVQVEQELIEEGLPVEEVQRLCDIHQLVLKGNIDLSGISIVPPGHPVDVFQKENRELENVTGQFKSLLGSVDKLSGDEFSGAMFNLIGMLNQVMDVEKHYQRKEYLLFPYLEKAGITGPPKVMWGKHDEIRELLKGSLEILKTEGLTPDDLASSAEIIIKPAIQGVEDMIKKEEEILLPMSMDNLTDVDWYSISRQTMEIGFCLYDPPVEWKPKDIAEAQSDEQTEFGDHIQLPSGSFSSEEIKAILNTMPADITFVDKNDKVKFFSQGSHRIFTRSRSIINRDVRLCHPPASVHIVEKIVDDFKSGRQDHAPFWINLGGKRFIHIEYFALRNDDGEYLGTLEVSQDLTTHRKLEGEQRILNYSENKNGE